MQRSNKVMGKNLQNCMGLALREATDSECKWEPMVFSFTNVISCLAQYLERRPTAGIRQLALDLSSSFWNLNFPFNRTLGWLYKISWQREKHWGGS